MSGIVRESGSRSVLVGVHITVPSLALDTTTHADGAFTLNVPAVESLTLTVSMVGYETLRKTIFLPKKRP